jgi:hypothetical protein
MTRVMRTIGAREPDSTAHPIAAEHPLMSNTFCRRLTEFRKQYKHRTKLNTANSDIPEMYENVPVARTPWMPPKVATGDCKPAAVQAYWFNQEDAGLKNCSPPSRNIPMVIGAVRSDRRLHVSLFVLTTMLAAISGHNTAFL